MEVVGAIASFVAIGQALAAIPKIIEALRSLVEVKQELLDLVNEVELLNSFGQLIRDRIHELPDNGSIQQPTLLRSVAADLASVVLQLEDLTRECQDGKKKNGQIKVARIKWLRHRPKIASLSEKAKRNREYLHLILSFTSLFASTSNGKMLVDIHTIVTTQAHPQAFLPAPLQFMNQAHRISDVSHIDCDDDEVSATDSVTGTGSADIARVAHDPRQLTLSNTVEVDSQPELHSEQLVQVTATLRRSCDKNCACQCHSPASRNRQHPAISPIVGWLKYAYNSVPRFGAHGCDVPTCRRARSPTRLTLRFPLLISSRALEASLSFGSLTGVGASLYLRVARFISSIDSIWWEIGLGKIELVRRRMSRREVSPFDLNQSNTLLEYALNKYQFEILSIFLEESMSVCRGTDLGRRVAAYARDALQHNEDIDERGTTVLQNLITLDDDADDFWPIHEVVRSCGDLVAVLKESSEGINDLDHFGLTPLHWAALYRDSVAIRTLITYGADLDRLSFDGQTPLMEAARRGMYDGADALIGAGCDVNRTDPLSIPAIFRALESPSESSAEQVSLLLDQGAQLTSVRPDRIALNYLAKGPVAAEIDKKFQLLIRAVADLEERDSAGLTPLMAAFWSNNKIMVRLLMDAGCKFSGAPGSSNTLHLAARWVHAEMMDVLQNTQFTVDVRTRDEDGYTPLDTFEWRMKTDPQWLPGDFQAPDDDEIEAFTRLLEGVRDRYLTAEIQALETVIKHLRAQNCTLAREALQPVIREKVHWDIPAEHRTFRAIDVQIKEEMIDAAIESLEEFIEVSRAWIGSDPFDNYYCNSDSLEDNGLLFLDSD
ncbi:ankyrin [Hypoxylon crocopeplum]|nr:ankyrin [Hypoxylon crocopeplum]